MAIQGFPELAGAPYCHHPPLLGSFRLRSELVAVKPLFEFAVSSLRLRWFPACIVLPSSRPSLVAMAP
jgi:hypothetical protein